MIRGRRPLTVAGASGGALLLVAAPALAFWTLSGSGTGTATSGNLPAPTGGAAVAAGPGVLALTWTAPSPAPTSYTVTNETLPAKGCTSTVTSCSISGLTEGTQYTFNVVAKLGNWESPASVAFTGTSGVTPPAAATFAITSPAANATVPTTVKVEGTAADLSTKPVTVAIYAGTATSGTVVRTTTVTNPTATTWQATPSSALVFGQQYTAVASQTGSTNKTVTFRVGAAASKLAINVPSGNWTAGVARSVTITAQRPDGTDATDYNGSFTFAGTAWVTTTPTPQVSSPLGSVTVTNGTVTVDVTLKKAGINLILTADSTSLTDASAQVSVNAGAQAGLAWSSSSHNCSTGVVFLNSNGATWTSKVTVTDAYGNAKPGAAVTVQVTKPADANGSVPTSPLQIPTSTTVAESDTATSYQIETGQPPAVTITASSTGLASATCAVDR